MRERLYFAYGSNLDAHQMRERCPGSEPRFRARLFDHRVDFTLHSRRWGGGAADVVRENGSLVWGVVYSLSDDDVSKLDTFERGYDKGPYHVLDDADELHETMSYTVRLKQPTLPPSEVYLNKMLTWSAHWGFPDDHVSLLRLARPYEGADEDLNRSR